MQVNQRDLTIPDNWDRRGLPAWSYSSPALLELEKEYVFRSHWQIAGHICDVPNVGDYISLDIVGERALVVRGKDGEIRAFHNICRHRGSRVVTDNKGTCNNALVCPFHGWVYNLDGTLRGASRPRSFPEMDKNEFGLLPLELEIWMGFIFIRFLKSAQPSVATLMKPFEAEIAKYEIADMVPAGFWTQKSPVNWKSVRDVDNEGYHVAMAHPALQDLYGSTYYDEPFINGVSRSFASYNPHAGRRWSVRNYINLAPEATHLPENLRNAWIYYGIFPNSVISVTPEGAQYYQEFPLSTGETLLRGAAFRHKDETRQQRAVRYLASRIDRETSSEDVQLTKWSNESMLSKSFSGFYLSDLEYGVRSHHDHLRNVLPILRVEKAPAEADVPLLNAQLAAQS
ncbi:aromatic ring-hydroxylating oxygenase subunit alpha [Phyllobacterium bourgognense]|uniref:Phenylpropionate dioxygenase-like ring-hydroxylating dioxygenase large terminal subunit n=1 Tax=Phyllobacterium bourgognense TaxID=314236 RepID=A0A368YMV7_9HYPH|nr:aromatic ring-hydroxylating dioxygenase subunit alpha [Phyllobacterium bourgognense]RCW81561.1 phenylpropionate dioxygenase-like ring-hydroxylating dioxygenase large terminal subunit [Phyllobacterium bourgognense]